MKVVLVGSDPASIVYTQHKKKRCEEIGADCEIIKLPENISESDFLKKVSSLNTDKSVHGIIVQLPLPSSLKNIDTGSLVVPEKDIDGFHPENIYKIFSGELSEEILIPCTPKGIINLLKFYKIDISGKRVTIIGRSTIVGKPLALLFTALNATVTLCHSKTPDIKMHTLNSDIVVAAIGKANLFGPEYFNKDAVVIDVGINRFEGKLCGDVHFEKVLPVVKAITPVPGGIGPMTVISLIENLFISTQKVIAKRN